MTAIATEQHANQPAGSPRGGRGKMILMWVVPFVVFAAVAIYSLAEKKNTNRVVAVIHATPLNADSGLVLPGALQAFVESPIYARTNGYLKKWYKDIGSNVK